MYQSQEKNKLTVLFQRWQHCRLPEMAVGPQTIKEYHTQLIKLKTIENKTKIYTKKKTLTSLKDAISGGKLP